MASNAKSQYQNVKLYGIAASDDGSEVVLAIGTLKHMQNVCT